MYAKELGLIADMPASAKGWREKGWGENVIQLQKELRRFKEKYWDLQSTAIKIAYVAAVVSLLSAFVYYYNFFTNEHYMVRLERAQIEAELQRKGDLIPSLVTVVNEYMSFEGKIFEHAADVRGALHTLKGGTDASSQAISMQSALSRFQAVAENYPDLKSSVTYQNLMKELSTTETRIAEARIKYNISANYYNSRLRMFPGIFFGFIMRFQPEPTFESEKIAKTAPLVK